MKNMFWVAVGTPDLLVLALSEFMHASMSCTPPAHALAWTVIVFFLSGIVLLDMDRSCRLLLKAGCRWYGICTFWVENLLFEVIL